MLRIGDKSPAVVVGEHDVVVEGDLEDPPVGLNELGSNPELALDAFRQTGGLGAIVSADTESDGDAVHWCFS